MAAEVEVLFPQFQNRLGTAGLRRDLEALISYAIRRETDEPFTLEVIDKGCGSWSIDVQPQMTEAEQAAQSIAFERINAEARAAEIVRDKRRAIEHPSRAHVAYLNGGREAYVSIPGMIEDLKHWQAPPDFYGEEVGAFHAALKHVVQYLETRERRA